jgi:hypothetical protein
MNWVNLTCAWLNLELVARIDVESQDVPKSRRTYIAKSAAGHVIARLSEQDIDTLRSTAGFPKVGPSVD